jgi:hypothetical protein
VGGAGGGGGAHVLNSECINQLDYFNDFNAEKQNIEAEKHMRLTESSNQGKLTEYVVVTINHF